MAALAIVIPTYKRTHLLSLLLQDLLKQTLQPDYLIIVDGEPENGEVLQMLSKDLPRDTPIIYVPSNHSNLPYQRFIGWRIATQFQVGVLIYLDDDQRISQPDVLEWLVKPLDVEGNIVGVGCFSRVPGNESDTTSELKAEKHWLVNLFGSSVLSGLKPGQLTPTGHRVGLVDCGEDYVNTEWLQGRIMAYKMDAITSEVFSEHLFAAYERRVGRAEDTFLSRRIGARGKMLFTFRASVEHPNADVPKAYPIEAFNYAYAVSYSRRFLNDNYRVYDSPTLLDRWALAKSYAGVVLLSWIRVLTEPNKHNFASFRGTTLGAFHGLIRPPTAMYLTPSIDWWADVEKALAEMVMIMPFDHDLGA